MGVQTPPKIRLPKQPTAAIRFAKKEAGIRNRVQAPGLDEFDLEAASAASAITKHNTLRLRRFGRK